jgi:hypothetical protein
MAGIKNKMLKYEKKWKKVEKKTAALCFLIFNIQYHWQHLRGLTISYKLELRSTHV